VDIEIPKELADAEGVPEDLNANVTGPYLFASPVRRRIAARIYAVGAFVAAAGAVSGLPGGMWVLAGGLGLLALHHTRSAHPLVVSDAEALAIAARNTEAAVGHASAALRFEGLFAKPVWNVLVYDAASPPTQRALVQIDAQSGQLVREIYVEPLYEPSMPG